MTLPFRFLVYLGGIFDFVVIGFWTFIIIEIFCNPLKKLCRVYFLHFGHIIHHLGF